MKKMMMNPEDFFEEEKWNIEWKKKFMADVKKRFPDYKTEFKNNRFYLHFGTNPGHKIGEYSFTEYKKYKSKVF